MLMTDKSSKNIYIGDWIEKDQELMSECRLWKHVVCQAISDSYLGSPKEKVRVGEWLMSDDYITVCDMAELHPENLFKLIKEILTSKPVVARYLGERLRKVIQDRGHFY